MKMNKHFASNLPLVLLIFVQLCASKIYERCELARELRQVHEIPDDQLATWLCIVRHESVYNTSAMNPGSGDHGLFQISQLFWCSPPGYACGVSCDDMRNDDIEDDVICARRIFREHKRISGDGFNAWVVYGHYCRDKQYAASFLDGCFPDGLRSEDRPSTGIAPKPLPTIDYYPQFARKTTTTTTTITPVVTIAPIISSSSTTASTTTASSRLTTLTTRKLTTPKATKPATASVKKHHDTSTTRKSTFTQPSSALTRKITRNKPISTTAPTTKKIVASTRFHQFAAGAAPAAAAVKPTVENDKFTFAITRTGYKFTRF